MSENIIKVGGVTAIINGGDPLPGCPSDWDEARKIEKEFNNGRDHQDDSNPYWSFDCGFKLDYDGSLVTVNSRFYPPKSHYGETWDGTVTIKLIGKTLAEKKFDCPTIEELRRQVEEYVNGIIEKIETAFS